MKSIIKLEITIETKGDQSALSADNIINKFFSTKNSACIANAKLVSVNVEDSADMFIRLINFGKSVLPKHIILRRRYSRDEMISYHTNIKYTYDTPSIYGTMPNVYGVNVYGVTINIYQDKIEICANKTTTFNYSDPNIKSQIEEYFKNLK